MIQSGIKRVIAPISNSERWRANQELAKQLLGEAGVELVEVD